MNLNQHSLTTENMLFILLPIQHSMPPPPPPKHLWFAAHQPTDSARRCRLQQQEYACRLELDYRPWLPVLRTMLVAVSGRPHGARWGLDSRPCPSLSRCHGLTTAT